MGTTQEIFDLHFSQDQGSSRQTNVTKVEVSAAKWLRVVWSYSRSDPGSFRSYSLSVQWFPPGSFRPDFRGGSFRPSFGGSFWPTLFYLVIKSFSGYPNCFYAVFFYNKSSYDLLIFSCEIFLFDLIRNSFRAYLSIYLLLRKQ